jgi:LysM repeat protein
MNRRHFFSLFALTMVAILLAVSLAIALANISNRPVVREQAAAVSLTRVMLPDGTIILLNPDPNREVELLELIALPEAVITEGQEAPPPTETIPQATAPPPEPTRDLNPVIFIEYTVQAGDNLYSIADRFNSSIELMALHGISDTEMAPGVHIRRLPIANPAYCPNRRPYVVRDRDTAYRIAVQFNTTADILREINNLSADYRVDVTQVICVP